jgi:hypothetical protein
MSTIAIKQDVKDCSECPFVKVEKATSKVYMPHGGTLTGGVDKQSILDVEKIIK